MREYFLGNSLKATHYTFEDELEWLVEEKAHNRLIAHTLVRKLTEQTAEYMLQLKKLEKELSMDNVEIELCEVSK